MPYSNKKFVSNNKKWQNTKQKMVFGGNATKTIIQRMARHGETKRDSNNSTITTTKTILQIQTKQNEKRKKSKRTQNALRKRQHHYSSRLSCIKKKKKNDLKKFFFCSSVDEWVAMYVNVCKTVACEKNF